jgi:hypothetical protein
MSNVLEDRLALSTVTGVHAAAVVPTAVKHPTVTFRVLSDVNQKVDVAFNRFHQEYQAEQTRLARTGNVAKFQHDSEASVTRLRVALSKQATRIPVAASAVKTALMARVDSLTHDLATDKTHSTADMIHSDQVGARSDISTAVHDQVVKGDLSIK